MKDFLEYLFGRLKAERPVTHKVGEQQYAVRGDGTLGDPVRSLAPQWIKPSFVVGTLSGIAELVKAKVDDFDGGQVALHVVDHVTVRLVSTKADEFARRHVYAEASHAEGSAFPFNKYIDAEDFLIQFRRSFLFNDEAVKVQHLISNLESGMSVSLADDGVSQRLEIKSGTTSRAGVTLPADGIALIPWRTFRDAAPVSQKFLLRLKGVKDSLPQIALYEIDQLWKLETIKSVAAWLEANTENIPIIA